MNRFWWIGFIVLFLAIAVVAQEGGGGIAGGNSASGGYGARFSVPFTAKNSLLAQGQSFTGEYLVDGVVKHFRVTLKEILSPPQECLDRFSEWFYSSDDCWVFLGTARLSIESTNGDSETIWGPNGTEAVLGPREDFPIKKESENYAISVEPIKKNIVGISFATAQPSENRAMRRNTDDELRPIAYRLFPAAVLPRITVMDFEYIYPKRIEVKLGQSYSHEYLSNGTKKSFTITLQKLVAPDPNKCEKPKKEQTAGSMPAQPNCTPGTGEITVLLETKTGTEPFNVQTLLWTEPDSKPIFEQLLEIHPMQQNTESVLFGIQKIRPRNSADSLVEFISPENSSPNQNQTANTNPTANPANQNNSITPISEPTNQEKTQQQAPTPQPITQTTVTKKPPRMQPEQAKQVLETNEKINCENLSQTASGAYECKTTQTGKLFGFIPIQFEVKATVNAENGQTSSQKPFWSFLVFQ